MARSNPGLASSFAVWTGWAHFVAGRYNEAIGALHRGLRINPDARSGYRFLAASYAHLGQLDEARSALDEALRLRSWLTISNLRLFNSATDPELRERLLEGLRKAGMKEE
jgi:Flp pilus assembly protein TadD